MIIPKTINRLIGQAMHTYNMLAEGDSVLVAVSGGVDSLVLTAILKEWQKKAPIKYKLSAVHIDMGFDTGKAAEMTSAQLKEMGIECHIEKTGMGPEGLKTENGKSACFYCARNRRTRLFSLAQKLRCNKLAFGHHKEDIIETFFLNVLYSGNISTMVPNQQLFNGNLSVIRPMAYLEKDQVKTLADIFRLTEVKNPCPLAGESKREQVRELLNQLYLQDEKIKGNIFSALSNIKSDYLLKKPQKSE